MDDIWSREEGILDDDAITLEIPEWSDGRMYAIGFDLDTTACKRVYPGSDWRHAYRDIQQVLEEFGFWNLQGSLYYSNHAKTVKVVQAILAIQARHPWFREAVRSLRMLRIEENDDLIPLLGQPELPLNPEPRKSSSTPLLKLN